MDRISGMSELQSAISAMTRDLSDHLPSIVLDCAKIIEAEIVSRAPMRTGALVENIDSSLASASERSASAIVQIENSAQGGSEQYAISQEYGTSKMSANPFFRPGVQAAKPKVEAMANQKILNVVASHDS